MKSLSLQSGDLIADRRMEMARGLAERGDFGAAADLMRQALEITPGWAAGWFQLGDIYMRGGDATEARDAFAASLRLDPADAMGATLRLNLMDGTSPPSVPDAYVRALFDDYAPRFDAALVGRLRYRAPEMVRAAVDAVMPGPLGMMLDLGCGTGLSGAAFAGRYEAIDGIDLSPGMIAEAARKNIYGGLEAADIRRWLKDCRDYYDCVIAVDVLIYMGRLDDVFAAVHRVTKPGGIFALTLQEGDRHPFALGADHRYSYTEDYLRQTAVETGWDIASLSQGVLRQDGGRDVPGFICVLRRQ